MIHRFILGVAVLFALSLSAFAQLSGGGGVAVTYYASFSNLTDAKVTIRQGAAVLTGSTQVRIGNNVCQVSASTFTPTAGTGTAFFYCDPTSFQLVVGHNVTGTCDANCVAASGVTAFPPGSAVFAQCAIVAGVATACTDKRPSQTAYVPAAGGGIPAATLGTGYAARPACNSGIAGQLYFGGGGLMGLCDPASLTWKWYYGAEAVTPPPAPGSFTAVGTGSIAADSSGAALILTNPSGSDPALEAALLAIPSGTSYDLIAAFTVATRANEPYMTCGLAVSDGTTAANRLASMAVALWDGRRYVEVYTTYGSVVAHLANTDGNGGAAMTRGALFWARINRAGTTYTFYEGSSNGDWGPPVFQTSALGFTPTHYGPYCDSRSATPVSITVRHLSGG